VEELVHLMYEIIWVIYYRADFGYVEHLGRKQKLPKV